MKIDLSRASYAIILLVGNLRSAFSTEDIVIDAKRVDPQGNWLTGENDIAVDAPKSIFDIFSFKVEYGEFMENIHIVIDVFIAISFQSKTSFFFRCNQHKSKRTNYMQSSMNLNTLFAKGNVRLKNVKVPKSFWFDRKLDVKLMLATPEPTLRRLADIHGLLAFNSIVIQALQAAEYYTADFMLHLKVEPKLKLRQTKPSNNDQHFLKGCAKEEGMVFVSESIRFSTSITLQKAQRMTLDTSHPFIIAPHNVHRDVNKMYAKLAKKNLAESPPTGIGNRAEIPCDEGNMNEPAISIQLINGEDFDIKFEDLIVKASNNKCYFGIEVRDRTDKNDEWVLGLPIFLKNTVQLSWPQKSEETINASAHSLAKKCLHCLHTYLNAGKLTQEVQLRFQSANRII